MPGQALAIHDCAPIIHPHRVKHALCDIDSEDMHLMLHWTCLLWLYGFTDRALIVAHRSRSAQERVHFITTTRKGFRSSHDTELRPSTVRLIRLRHGRLHRYKGPRPRRVVDALTVPQIATAVGVKPHWIYHLISSGRIGVQRDEETGLYLFPDRLETLEAFRQLRDGQRTELRA